jgi:hypothetical protein
MREPPASTVADVGADHGVGEVARIEAACVDAWMERVTFKLQL